jgi:hypothetical protein
VKCFDYFIRHARWMAEASGVRSGLLRDYANTPGRAGQIRRINHLKIEIYCITHETPARLQTIRVAVPLRPAEPHARGGGVARAAAAWLRAQAGGRGATEHYA